MVASAFMSYAHADESHDRGYISDLCSQLSGEIRAQTGSPFDIFIDRKDIQWGQEWQRRIEQGLDNATFLIPILTPSFFKSEQCRAELQAFANGRATKRFVLPIYYIAADELRAPSCADPLVSLIKDHQWIDWRNLRFEPFEMKAVRVAIAQLASSVKEALAGIQVEAVGTKPVSNVAPSLVDFGRADAETTADIGTQRVVDLTDGPYATISDALVDAQAGDRIVVKPGVYYDRFVLTMAVEIVGDGAAGEIIVEEDGDSIIESHNVNARIQNLRICQLRKRDAPAVLIMGGRLIIDNCDITSRAGNCIAISDRAEPIIKNSHIHHGGKGGIAIWDCSRPLITGNDIDSNYLSGVFLFDRAAPFISGNRIHDGAQSGIYAYGDATGVIERNEIFRNAHAGVATAEGANPYVYANRVYQSGHYGGVYVFRGGRGIFEENDLTGNRKGPWQVDEACRQYVVRRNNRPSDD